MSKVPVPWVLVGLLTCVPLAAGDGVHMSMETRSGDERAMTWTYHPQATNCHDPSIDIVRFEVSHDGQTLYVAETVKDIETDPSCAPLGRHVPLHRVDVWWAAVIEDTRLRWGIHMITKPTADGGLERCIEMGPYGRYGHLLCEPDVSSPVYAWTMPLVGEYTDPTGEMVPYDLRGRFFDNVAAYAWSVGLVDPAQPRLKVDFFDDSPRAEMTL